MQKSIMQLTAEQNKVGNIYYINSNSGNDHNDGLSPENPWESLARVNEMLLKPGDKILFKAGTKYSGQLKPQGSGIDDNGKIVPIVIDKYGKGKLPRFDAQGKFYAAIYLHNVEGYEVRNIEITNTGEKREKSRYGIWIHNETIDTARHYILRGLYIHGVNGTKRKSDEEAGVAIMVSIKWGAKLRFDTVVVEECHIADSERDAIRIWGVCERKNWYPSFNIIVRNNLIEGVGGDGIVPCGCDGAIIEWNIMRKCSYLGETGGAAAGIWPWSCDNTVIQFNEVSDHKAWVDGQAYDCDFNCYNTLFQYNYSCNNIGGFMLVCSPGKEEGANMNSIIKHNISINDGARTEGLHPYFSPSFYITGDGSYNTRICNNLIIVPQKADPQMDSSLFVFDEWFNTYAVKTNVENNVFCLMSGQKGTFTFSEAKQITIKENCFYGDVAELKETPEVKLINNYHYENLSESITIKGEKEELSILKDFLEKKGNPHIKAGVAINWH